LIRGNSAGVLRAPASHAGDMSGASVSRTMAVERQRCREATDARRPEVGHGAAEAEPEAQPDELVGLLATAIEGMRDAARHADPAQLA
jgi:hypothetical protein